jgi:hypothetical protein
VRRCPIAAKAQVATGCQQRRQMDVLSAVRPHSWQLLAVVISGSGHTVMLEKNNFEIVEVLG